MRKRVYIAGAISKGGIAENVRLASEAFFTLLKAGLAPLCPHWSVYSGGPYEAPIPKAMPNGTTHEDWLEADLPWVAAAEALLRLPGESAGADREEALARSLWIPVFFDIDQLIRWGRIEARNAQSRTANHS